MANVNNVLLVGRLTRDPEVRSFASGGKNAKFGLVVNGRKKDKASGKWEDDPMFIDVEVWNRGEFGKSANFVEERLKKGSQVLVQGQLVLDQWDDKQTGQKRSKHKIVADSIQALDKKEKAESDGAAPADVPAASAGGEFDIPLDSEIPF